MSLWCYLLGAVMVNGLERTEEANLFKVKTVLRSMPIISGSERPCYISVLPSKEYDYSYSQEDYPNPINTIGRTDLMFDTFTQANTKEFCSKYNWDAGTYHLSSSVLIVLNGALRDVSYEKGIGMIVKWLNRLSKNLLVQRISLTLNSDMNQIFNFNNYNTRWVFDNYNYDSSTRFDKLINWNYRGGQ